MKVSHTLAFDKDLILEIDHERGDIPRSRFVERLLREAIEQRKSRAQIIDSGRS
jgi:hypothetical protein